jgi:hypothetical protein
MPENPDLQVEIGTDSDARSVCGGGEIGLGTNRQRLARSRKPLYDRVSQRVREWIAGCLSGFWDSEFRTPG